MKIIRDNDKKNYNIEKAYHDKKYIVTYKAILQPFVSQDGSGQYYAREVYRLQESNFARRGRFHHMSAKAVNRLIGFEHLREL